MYFITIKKYIKIFLIRLHHPKCSKGPHLSVSRPKSLHWPTRPCPVFCFHTPCELPKSPSYCLPVHIQYRHTGTLTALQTRQACSASGSLHLLFLCLVHFSPRYQQGWLPHLLRLEDLSSPTRDKLMPPAVESRSPNHWTAREFPS